MGERLAAQGGQIARRGAEEPPLSGQVTLGCRESGGRNVPSDDTFTAPVTALTPEDLAELRGLVDDLDALDVFVDPSSAWVSYVGPVSRLVQWLYDHRLVVVFDWALWDEGSRVEPSDISGRPVADSVRMLTAILRNDRFCEGALDAALRSGMVQACLRRILEATT